MDIKLLALDMDGTTYFKMGEIVPSNINPIKKAIEQGIDVAIVTGRPVLAKQNKLKEHGFVSEKSVIVGYNGGCIYHILSEKIISSNPIDSDMAKKAFELTKEPRFKNVIIWGYVDDLKKVILSHNKNQDDIDNFVYQAERDFFDGQYIRYDEIKDDFNYNFFKLLAFNSNEEFNDELSKIGFEIAPSKDFKTVEINKNGINKKFAVQWLSENWCVPIENIMSIGDGMNDLPMIEYAGVGVAMKNSIDEIKNAAQIYIDLTNEQGAVGQIIEQYVLKKEK